MRQERADRVLETLLRFGVNHIDTAAGYGDSELRLAPWMQQHRARFFLATKTRERSYAGARDGIQKSLERLEVDCIDMIQFHNLVDEDGWNTAMGPGGALEAAIEARDAGHVRFIGVTGHGTRAAEMHLRSLQRFPFDSVLLPYSYPMMSGPEYAQDFAALLEHCEANQVAVQTIKSIARRRWEADDSQPRFSWYEPIRDSDAIRRAVHWVLSKPRVFLNTSSDATLLEEILAAADSSGRQPSDDEMSRDVARLGLAPLFERGVSDQI
jgi:aryl-alcohol dehydrogenase-like predicted oxidoreductase